jgi:hypothetical protein
LAENQSEECCVMARGVLRLPTVFMCCMAGFGGVTWYRAKLASVAKYILQLSEMVQARLAVGKW